MNFARIVPPTATCVSVDLVRRNSRVRHGEEAENIDLFIRAAEGLVEKRTGRSIMRQTFRLTTDRIIAGARLWYPPMEGEVTIKRIEETFSGITNIFDPAKAQIGYAAMLPYVAHPTRRASADGSMIIEYDSGVDKPAQVPPMIRQAVLLLAGHYYRNREAAQTDTRISTSDKALPFGVDDLVAAYRIPNINAPFYD